MSSAIEGLLDVFGVELPGAKKRRELDLVGKERVLKSGREQQELFDISSAKIQQDTARKAADTQRESAIKLRDSNTSAAKLGKMQDDETLKGQIARSNPVVEPGFTPEQNATLAMINAGIQMDQIAANKPLADAALSKNTRDAAVAMNEYIPSRVTSDNNLALKLNDASAEDAVKRKTETSALLPNAGARIKTIADNLAYRAGQDSDMIEARGAGLRNEVQAKQNAEITSALTSRGTEIENWMSAPQKQRLAYAQLMQQLRQAKAQGTITDEQLAQLVQLEYGGRAAQAAFTMQDPNPLTGSAAAGRTPVSVGGYYNYPKPLNAPNPAPLDTSALDINPGSDPTLNPVLNRRINMNDLRK
jgi:hypothetical protein